MGKYVASVQNNKPHYNRAGRPPTVSPSQLESLRLMHEDPQIKMTSKDWTQNVIEACRKTCAERNQAQGGILTVSRSVVKAVEDKLGVITGKAQSTTEARAKACADVRNGVTFAVMNGLMVPNCQDCLILNADATQYTVGNGSKDTKIKYIPNSTLAPKIIKGGNGMNFFIKFYLLISASGHQGDPIYIIADPRMGEDDMHCIKVPGLGINTNPKSFGHIVYVKERTCNKTFYKWFNTHFLIPYVRDMRERREEKARVAEQAATKKAVAAEKKASGVKRTYTKKAAVPVEEAVIMQGNKKIKLTLK